MARSEKLPIQPTVIFIRRNLKDYYKRLIEIQNPLIRVNHLLVKKFQIFKKTIHEVILTNYNHILDVQSNQVSLQYLLLHSDLKIKSCISKTITTTKLENTQRTHLALEDLKTLWSHKTSLKLLQKTYLTLHFHNESNPMRWSPLLQ